jgi:Xaa-Pro aminopeptidase
MNSLITHSQVQAVAKAVHAALGTTITPADTERTIAQRATHMLIAQGISETWYYNCPAFVLLGSRSCLSQSGREYVPADEPVGMNNLVTVDLSPMQAGVWGDCARSFVIEEGRWTTAPKSEAFALGIDVEKTLHQTMRAFVTPSTTFEELYAFGNAQIQSHGFENLDFLGNLGHSIATRREDRQYIKAGNTARLATVPFFTFEPHVRKAKGVWGFKHEEIYYFDPQQQIQAL